MTFDASEYSKVFNVSAYRHILFDLGSNAAANMTIIVQAAIGETAPDFTAAQDEDNRWDKIQVKDREDDTGENGDEALVVSGKDSRLFEVNTNGIDWLNFRSQPFVAGVVKISGKCYNNA